MWRRVVGRAVGVGVLAASVLITQPGIAEANSCTWTEYTYKVTFQCHATSTSFAVCNGSAQFAYYRENPVTVRTGSFGGSKTISSGSRYVVRGSEQCSAS